MAAPPVHRIPDDERRLCQSMSDGDRFPLEVWIDGSCAVCRRSERWCRERDHHGRLEFKDLNRDADPPASRGRLATSVHVRSADGSVASGFEAWRRILLSLDRWRWLGRITALPGLHQLGSMVYSLIAANRHRLPGGLG
jgi:predicted DCC family thiol-disulfide oxidoreductase YuxK